MFQFPERKEGEDQEYNVLSKAVRLTPFVPEVRGSDLYGEGGSDLYGWARPLWIELWQ